MEILKLDNYTQNDRTYGGLSGNKIGLTIEGKNYLIKFPGNLKEKSVLNAQRSYSNSPLCEYIGSHIYETLGFNVHKTYLGIRNKKLVVACEDFLEESDHLQTFKELKTTFEPFLFSSENNTTDGNGTELSEILQVIKEHPLLKNIPNIEDHFWKMFVVDTFIGNGDRNNENWGIIRHADGKKELSPVYDNGNCFNTKWDDKKMQVLLTDEELFKDELYRRKICCFTENEHRIHPYKLLNSMKYEGLNKAIKDIVPKIYECHKDIVDIIKNLPTSYNGIEIASDIMKKCFTKFLKEKYSQVILPAYNKITMEQSILTQPKSKSHDAYSYPSH